MRNATRKSKKPAAKKRAPAKPRNKKALPAVKSDLPAVPQKPTAIVGIGASAGGLEAFTQMLRALPANTGMGFVFVQHLEPRHESMLTKLLASSTSMPVSEVKQGAVVEPNHIYVIPSNADIRVAGGVLQVAGRKAPIGKHLPVDVLFRSLAEDQGARAVGVVLSGMASDGTLGLKAIKVDGGITFAQDPETAKFDGMPTSAISAGCVDFILSPEKIANELAQISRHAHVGLARLGEAVVALPARDEEWQRVFRLLRGASGVDFTFYKKNTIKRRIARRMALHKIEHLSAYVKYLEAHHEELNALNQDILIQVTSFFREPEVFRALQTRVVPRLLGAKTAGEPIRVWSAGCSTGEETYSLAICLLENLGSRASSTPIQMFGTDISERATEKARAGIYPADAMTQVSTDRLRKFFTKVDGRYQINAAVRDQCVFARHDLTKDPPFSRLDIISCRNVLIYLEPVLQKRVLASFHYALKDTGVLLLGKSETLGAFSDLFKIVDRKHKFFRRKPAAGVAYEVGATALERLAPQGKRRTEDTSGFDLEKEADRVVWDRYAHAGLVVNNDLQILHFRGDTSPYLRPAPGKATFHLLRMLKDELVFELRSALHKARRSGNPVRRDAIRVNGSFREVSVEVRPINGPAKESYFLILLEETGQAKEPPAGETKRTRAQDQEMLRVKTELARTKDYLQSVIQEQESTNEELKTANEEALSSMEELQSANEELETAKEELQSSNEELVTLNEQLQNRNAELTQMTDDLSNVLNGLNMPIVMLDNEQRVRRFTPAAERLLHLLPGDVGRPLSDIRVSLNVPNLEFLATKVTESGREVRQEVKGDDGLWFTALLCPYRNRERAISGILMAFVEISELKQSQETTRKEQSLVTAIVDAASNDLVVLVMDREGQVVRFNRACQQLTGYSQEEVAGRRFWDFLVSPADASSVRAAFVEVRGGTFIRREDYWLAKDGQRRRVLWSSSVVRTDDVLEYVVATGIDVTERQQAREEAKEKEATMQALLESAAQAVLAHNGHGRIVLVNTSAEAMFGYSRQELLEKNIEELIPDGLRRRQARQRAGGLKFPQNRPSGGVELTGLRKDGTDFSVEVTLSHIETKDGLLGVSIVSDITDRKNARLALLQSQEELRELAGRLLSIQETETQLVARDLHDDLSQKLAAMGMEAASFAKSADWPEAVKERGRELGQRISALSEEVHGMARRLHPVILQDLGLEAALREECLSFAQRTGVPVDFQATEVPRGIAPDVALCFFRVAQEALRNVSKHSKAEQVRMRLARHKSDLALMIEDIGDGFRVEEARGQGGLGLISMEERVRLVNGEFSIRSEPGQGTEIEVHVPLDSQPK